MRYDKNLDGETNWIIEEEIYDPINVKKIESIMCIGNGFMDSRSPNVETVLYMQRDVMVPIEGN